MSHEFNSKNDQKFAISQKQPPYHLVQSIPIIVIAPPTNTWRHLWTAAKDDIPLIFLKFCYIFPYASRKMVKYWPEVIELT